MKMTWSVRYDTSRNVSDVLTSQDASLTSQTGGNIRLRVGGEDSRTMC